MSDKPIYADIVRADQIRVGDRILCNGIHAVGVQRISSPFTAWIEIRFDDGHPTVHVPRDKFVARILPEPVEVREFWRVRYKRYYNTPDGTGYATRYTDSSPTREIAIERFSRRLPAGPAEGEPLVTDATIEHVRETIISRKEVQP